MRPMLTDSAIWVALLGFAFYVVRKLWENSSVNKAILAEAGRLLAIVEDHKDFWERRVADGTTDHHPFIPLSHVVYDTQVKNVGVIARGHVELVVRFYGYVEFINSLQALRKKYEKQGNSDEFFDMYIRALGTLLRRFDKPPLNRFKGLEKL